jgi:hypothetical protein
MHAIRAPQVFDGFRFLSEGATAVLNGDRIAGVETGRVDLPDGVEVTEYPAPCCRDCSTATPTWSPTRPSVAWSVPAR